MSVPPEYVLAKMEVEKTRAQAKVAGAPSGKRYFTPSRNRDILTAPMLGSPMAVPPEYVLAKMQMKKSHAHYTPPTAATERPNSTLPRTSHPSSALQIGSPMAVPAEYVWAKKQERQSRKQSRKSSLCSAVSASRCSTETTCSYDKPTCEGKRSMRMKIREYLH